MVYSTMLREVDRQVASKTGGQLPNLVVASVGVGSWAHSVVKHYKAASSTNRVVTVEPEAAPCLQESLRCNEITPLANWRDPSAMECAVARCQRSRGPILRDGVDVAVVVTDRASHECVQDLQARKVNAGPCGGSYACSPSEALPRQRADEGRKEKPCALSYSVPKACESMTPRTYRTDTAFVSCRLVYRYHLDLIRQIFLMHRSLFILHLYSPSPSSSSPSECSSYKPHIRWLLLQTQ